MPKVWEKVLTFLGLMEETEEEVLEEVEFNRPRGRKAPVLNLHNSKSMRLVIAKPVDFAEAQPMVENIKAKKPVLINLEGAEPGEARRIVDFLSGATYALDGNMQKVSQQIFVFAPPQVEVNAYLQRSLEERSVAATREEQRRGEQT